MNENRPISDAEHFFRVHRALRNLDRARSELSQALDDAGAAFERAGMDAMQDPIDQAFFTITGRLTDVRARAADAD